MARVMEMGDVMSAVEIPTNQAVASLLTKYGEGDFKKMDALIKRFCGEDAKFGQPLTDEQRTIIAAFIAEEERAKQEAGTVEIPKARHLCTDLANANRLRINFGKRIISVGGVIYAWQGTHWAPDNAEAHRLVAKLSAVVAQEKKREIEKYNALLKQNPDASEAMLEHLKHPQRSSLSKSDVGRKILEARVSVEALDKWEKQCEMKPRQDAALKSLRDMLDIDASKLDSDPWLLNCKSGTIDLRTGQIRPHDPADFITKIAPVSFEPSATAPIFEHFLRDILDDEHTIAFLQRWFGYCSTGLTREQQFLIHTGKGGNGKGTLIGIMQSILGDYANAGSPGLIADSGRGADRHPTEIANLKGRRMVTASESDDGAVLRDGFVKQATGEDMLSGRWMHGNFFDFKPTHKLQLLTNHKPVIRGQDFSIWRRILLVDYPHQYGSREEVESGKAQRVKDPALSEKLHAERAGIFAWLIRGAVEWARVGLNPPPAVRNASAEYQSEQDRVGMFVTERCVKDPTAWVPYTGASGAVFTSYQRWCRDYGFTPMAISKFLSELATAVPGVRLKQQRRLKGGDKRALGLTGLRLDESTAECEFADQDAPKPPKKEPPPAKAAAPKSAPIVVDDEALDTSWMHEEPVNPAPTKTPRQVLMHQLGINEGDADRFIDAGFGTVEEIRAPGFARVRGFSESYLRDIQSRARDIAN